MYYVTYHLECSFGDDFKISAGQQQQPCFMPDKKKIEIL
jgi:hypothetical protein